MTAPGGASDSPWRLAGLSWGSGGATWGTLGYAYRGTAQLPGDGAKLGRIASGELAASLGWSWQLDAASRLVGASSGVGSEFRQSYGEADQLLELARDDTGEADSLGWGPSGRLTGRDGVAFASDASGRRTTDDRGSYRWDWRGRLAEATVSPDAGSPFAGHQVRYLYDGVGRLRARVHLGPESDGARPFIEYRGFLWEGSALLGEAGFGSHDGSWDDPATDLFPRWRRTYVPGPGLDDAPAVRVEIFEPADTPFPDTTYAFLRDELGTVVGVLEDGSSPDPDLLLRYLYTPYGEAHAEAGPEPRGLLFDNDRTTVDTYVQTVADSATHAAGALLLTLSLPADPATLASGVTLTDDTAGTVLVQGTDYVALPLPDQPEVLALLPLEGWAREHAYRVTLTTNLTDTAGRPLARARQLPLLIPAEGAVTAAAPPDLAITYDSVAAASATLGGRFPGGQTLLFQGLWTDPTTGLAYARNRWYDPHNAAWLSEDPALDVDSTNLYAFVGWGPHGATDPLGEESIRELLDWEGDREKGHFFIGGVKELGYDIWNLVTFNFLSRHDEAFEEYERTGDTSKYVKDTAVEVGRAGTQIALTAVSGGTAAAAGRTVVGRVAAGAASGAGSGLASTAAMDVYDRATGGEGYTSEDYMRAAVGGAIFGAPLLVRASSGRRRRPLPQGEELASVRQSSIS